MVKVGELPELIDEIVNIVLEPSETPLWNHRFLTHGPDNYKSVRIEHVYFPRTILYPLLFVNRTWLEVVKRHLYHSIGRLASPRGSLYGGYGGYSDDPDLKPMRFQSLFSTLEHIPARASVVRELHLKSISVGDETTVANITLIGLCPNLRCVDFYGWDVAHLPHLMNALRGVRQLEVLILGNGPALMKLEELFYHMITFWPNLSTFVAGNLTIVGHLGGWQTHDGSGADEDEERVATDQRDVGDEGGEDGPSTKNSFSDATLRTIMSSPPRSSCSRLQRLCLNFSGRLHAKHFRALSRIAPNIKDLQVRLHLYGNSVAEHKDICESLHTWAPTLETLTVTSNIIDAHAFTPIDSGFICLSALAHAPVLETLICWVRFCDSDALIRALPNYQQLKTIKVHRLGYSTSKATQNKLVLAALEHLSVTKGLSYKFLGRSR